MHRAQHKRQRQRQREFSVHEAWGSMLKRGRPSVLMTLPKTEAASVIVGGA